MGSDPWDRYEAAVEALPTACALCGKDPAAGLATIGDDRYCHEGVGPTCYERAQWAELTISEHLRGI